MDRKNISRVLAQLTCGPARDNLEAARDAMDDGAIIIQSIIGESMGHCHDCGREYVRTLSDKYSALCLDCAHRVDVESSQD